jgi:spermidine synthase
VTGDWYTEPLHPGFGQSIEIIETLVREKTDYQDIAIHQTKALGRVLLLDGIVQTSEADEFYYHEMMAHLPIVAHGDARSVLIIGGGDGGTLREVLKHSEVERATLVEIDPRVVELSRRHLPGLSAGAFDDPRARVVIADGAQFIARTDERFDVMIIDSTDPVGPSLALFDDPFYCNCAERLGERGILIRQAGVPFFQKEEYVAAYSKLRRVFGDCGFALVAVPTYCGGDMALAWASNDPQNRQRSAGEIAARFGAAAMKTRYYSPEIHMSAFALPAFMKAALSLD